MGRGRGLPELEKLAGELDIGDRVQFLGFIDNPFPYLGRADLFVQASRYEGFGMALLEALSLGVPVVATDCPHGPREILANGRYGKLVPVDDIEALAKAMDQTLDDPLDRTFLIGATEPYTVEVVTGRYIKTLGLPEEKER